MKSETRILAAIMFTDIVGYTAMMQKNETHTKKLRDKHRAILEEKTLLHKGSVIQYYGDGTLSIFGSAVEAVNAAIIIQKELQNDPVVPVKIGLHIGDIVYDDDGVFGDGVNIASRIESLSVPGSVLFSDKINDELLSHPSFKTQSLGHYELKNVNRPVEVFALNSSGLTIPSTNDIEKAKVKSKKSIAVLPFVNMSADPENEYFSDGITEEILNALAQVDGLHVTSRTSSFAFKGKNTDIREIGKQLNVSTVLEGSVRRSGKKVRVTAQLISSADGFHLWSEVYDRDLEDIFVVQDEISLKISNTLQQKLSLDNKKEHLVKVPTHNLEAYNLLLKGKFHLNKWSPEDANQAIDCFNRALKLEPEMAAAYSALGGVHTFLGAIGWNKPLEAFPLAEQYVKKALELDNQLAESHMADALVKFFYNLDMPATYRAFQRALELNPNSAEIKVYYTFYLNLMDRNEEALRILNDALSSDPLSINILSSIAKTYMHMKDYKNALIYTDKILTLEPNMRGSYETKGWIYLFDGQLEKSIEMFKRYESQVPDPLKGVTGLGYAYAQKGDFDKAREYLDKIKKRQETDLDTQLDIDLAIIYSGLNEIDNAFFHIEKAFLQKHGVLFVSSHPGWEQVREDPRFAELLQRIGFKK